MPGASHDFNECAKLMNYSPIEITQIAGLSCISPTDVLTKVQEALSNEQ